MKNYESLNDALNDLKIRGYEADFTTQTVCLYCGDLDIRLDPGDFNIDEVYRFADGSTPDILTLLYAITSVTGVKGTLVDTSGVHIQNMNLELIAKTQNSQIIASV